MSDTLKVYFVVGDVVSVLLICAQAPDTLVSDTLKAYFVVGDVVSVLLICVQAPDTLGRN